jgi:hypothetical protein
VSEGGGTNFFSSRWREALKGHGRSSRSSEHGWRENIKRIKKEGGVCVEGVEPQGEKLQVKGEKKRNLKKRV